MEQILIWLDKHPDIIGIFIFVTVITNFLLSTIKLVKKHHKDDEVKFKKEETWDDDDDDPWDVEYMEKKDKAVFSKPVDSKKKKRVW